MQRTGESGHDLFIDHHARLPLTTTLELIMQPYKFVVAHLRKRADDRLFLVMHTLLYPGVLGSLIYAFPDNILSGKTAFTIPGTLVAIGFFFAFSADYLHSISIHAKASYSFGTFIADLAIIVLIFCAGQKILGTALFPSVSELWFLMCAKFFAIVWESVTYKATSDSAPATNNIGARTPSPRETDLGFMLAYLLAGLLGYVTESDPSDSWTRWVLAVLLLADAFWYFLYRFIPEKPK